MDEFDDTEISRLLRLKRYEQPPPAYFENFLHEFHRRQRDELLREPLWRIAWQRTQDFLFRLELPGLTSAPVALAAVLVCAAIVSLRVYEAPQNPAPQNVATAEQAAPQASWNLSSTPMSARALDSGMIRQVQASSRTHRAVAAPPRYVLDSTPVSYEPAVRF